MPPIPKMRRFAIAVLVVAGLVVAGCGGDDDSASSDTSTSKGAEQVTVRLGYFPNITHAPAIVGELGGLFAKAVGPNVEIETSSFNAGPEAVEALFAEALDMTFIGPNPTINAYAQSDGAAIRIVSGATSGGAYLVVRDEIDGPQDLAGTTLATPQLGNTQDVALRAWLDDQGYESDDAGGGDVSIQPQANGEALAAFMAGDLDGAWVPEPWATRFIQEGGAQMLVDESHLWPGGEYVTTHLIVRTAFLGHHPAVVEGIIEGLAKAIDLTASDPAKAKALTNQGIEAVTDEALTTSVLDAAWANLHFTLDPVASSLSKSAQDAVAAGLLEPVDLHGIYDLRLLNQVRVSRGEPRISGS